MSGLPPDDHRKLVGILARLGSPADGERAAAGLLATRLLGKHKLSWEDVMPLSLPSPTASRWYQETEQHDHRADASRCLNSGLQWKPHERKFLDQMRQQRRAPTDKQRGWLDGLVDRVARQEVDIDW